MICYAPPDMYTEKVAIVEMLCASVCLTSMVCLSLEVRYGNMFDSQVHMPRHRVGARGNATSFPLPWQHLLALLRDVDESSSGQQQSVGLPRAGPELSNWVHI